MSAVRVRTVIVCIVLAALIPLTVFSGYLLLAAARRQRARVDRQNIETARAISIAVDQYVATAITALDAVASLDVFDRPDLGRAQEFARRLVPRQPDWHGVLLTDADGRLLLNTIGYFPTASQFAVAEWTDEVRRTRRPAVTNAFEGSGFARQLFVIVAVPVLRRGEVVAVLGAQLRLDGLARVVQQQQTPPEGVVTLIDRNQRIIARSRGDAALLGQPASDLFTAASKRMNEGTWQGVTLEGTRSYSALSRSPLTGWTVGIAQPADAIDGPIRTSLVRLGLVGLALLIVSGSAAMWLGATIVSSVADAAAAAEALGRGRAVAVKRSPLVELEHLWAGLEAGSRTLADRDEQRRMAEEARAEAARERERAFAAERDARREAEAANRAKDEFLMVVSHELRTPLTAIQGWARMLTSGEIRDERRGHALQAIERNAHALGRLVDDLLDASRSAAGTLTMSREVTDIAAVIDAAVESIAPAAAARGVDVHTHAEYPGARVYGDSRRLEQVVWNLLSNATKFMPGGGRIDVTTRRSGDDVEIVVRDSGPGIDPEFLPFVFDRFRQAAQVTTREHGGLGLGLAITREIVELHGGRITAENNSDGPGATFRVCLPDAVARASAGDPGASVPLGS